MADSMKGAATKDGPKYQDTIVDTKNAQLMTDDEYYPYLTKPNINPAIWRWRDIEPPLQEVAKDPLRRADRRFLALVNSDTGDNGGALPSIFLGIQIINPGEHIVPHRHSSFAIYHIMSGSGYSVLDGTRYDWEQGDTLVCPAWASHEHFNDGDQQAVQYVVQDMPLRANERNLIWEEPIGRMFHMVKGEEGGEPHQD